MFLVYNKNEAVFFFDSLIFLSKKTGSLEETGLIYDFDMFISN
jgi:hypothetical protein